MTIVDVPIVRRVLSSSILEALTAPHGIDRYVELVAPTLVHPRGAGAGRGGSSAGRPTASPSPSARTAWTGFTAGQFTQVTVEIDGVRHTRCYSMASSGATDADAIELTSQGPPGGPGLPHLRSVRRTRACGGPRPGGGRLHAARRAAPSASCSSAAAAGSPR